MALSFEERVKSQLKGVQECLALHGGGVELADIDVEKGIVRVRFQGACVGCSFAAATFESIVEAVLADVAGVKDVFIIT